MYNNITPHDFSSLSVINWLIPTFPSILFFYLLFYFTFNLINLKVSKLVSKIVEILINFAMLYFVQWLFCSGNYTLCFDISHLLNSKIAVILSLVLSFLIAKFSSQIFFKKAFGGK